MRAVIVVVAALAALPLVGCILETGHVEGRVVASTSVEVDENFVYFPSQHAYYSDSTNVWWVVESGAWVQIGYGRRGS